MARQAHWSSIKCLPQRDLLIGRLLTNTCNTQILWWPQVYLNVASIALFCFLNTELINVHITGTERFVPATDASEAELFLLICLDVGNSEVFSPAHSATWSAIQVHSGTSQPSLYGLQFFST